MRMRTWMRLILALGLGIWGLWLMGAGAVNWMEKQENETGADREEAEDTGVWADREIQPNKETWADTGAPEDEIPINEETGTEEQDPKRVALTFDDGPHPSYTEQLLDGLKERGIKASFFVLGEHAQLHPDIIRRMQEEGHLIGNHTYSHIQLKDDNWEVYREELIRTNEVIREITGQEVAYVRPPYGSWDRSFEEELNMFPVLWTVDSRDWCSRDSCQVTAKVVRETKEGDIILMHDYYESSVEAALAVADELQAEGYTFVTVEEILFE